MFIRERLCLSFFITREKLNNITVLSKEREKARDSRKDSRKFAQIINKNISYYFGGTIKKN